MEASQARRGALDRLTWTTVDLIFVVRTVGTTIADCLYRYATAVVAGEAVVVASVARTAAFAGIRWNNNAYLVIGILELILELRVNFNSRVPNAININLILA